eukprot:31297-Pelagococcus_subviridis.AAC.14
MKTTRDSFARRFRPTRQRSPALPAEALTGVSARVSDRANFTPAAPRRAPIPSRARTIRRRLGSR